MNISSNNMRGFSQYSLLNKLFSQKNGKKTSTSNQMGAVISGGVKHKHSNLYYDENGIPWMSKEQADRCITGRSDWKKIVSVSDEVKAELAEVVKQDFISTNGKSIPEGTRTNASKKPQGTDENIPETTGQKMKRLAQEWRDAYKTSGSKESGMEKVLSMLNDMFGIRKEA